MQVSHSCYSYCSKNKVLHKEQKDEAPPPSSGESPIEQELVRLTEEDDEDNDKERGGEERRGGEVQSVASVTDPEITSEVLSSGTPSNIYNPKDSDSIIPTHLLGSYNGSVEGDIGGTIGGTITDGKNITEERAIENTNGVTSGTEPVGGKITTAPPLIAADEDMNSAVVTASMTTSENGEGKTSPPYVHSDDSETRTLLQ